MGGGTKHQREPSKVFTFHPACQTHNPNTTTKQYVLQAEGSLQQVSPRRDGCDQVVPGRSQVGEGISTFRDQRHNKPSSYTVYTIAGSQLLSSTSGERPRLPGESGSMSPVTCNWTDSITSNGIIASQGSHQPTNTFTHLTPRNIHTSRELTR